MTGRSIFEGGLEILAVKLIERYPICYLSKIKTVWPHVKAIRVPDGSRPNTLRVIIRGLDQEVRAFEVTRQGGERRTYAILFSHEHTNQSDRGDLNARPKPF